VKTEQVVPAVLERLESLNEQIFSTAELAEDPQEAAMLRRAGHALARRLPLWREVAAGRPFFLRLWQAVERYELTGSPAEAAQVSALLAAWSAGSEEEARHRQQLEEYYRNSNLRWEVSEEVLNQWVQPQPTRSFRVRDVILGRPVIGESRSDSEARFVLVPDASRLRFRLMVVGRVFSATQSLAGQATFFDHSYGAFVGWKEIELTEEGLRISPPQVRADQRVELRGLRTSFDGIPLLGSIAQEIALSQRERSMPEAQAEARQKLIARIVQQFETEATPKLSRLQYLLETRLLAPARKLELRPTLVQACTFTDRMIARWRLAGEGQLGGHTPRPRLPEEVAIGFQIHQSAVNNVLARLELAGNVFTPAQLRARIAQLLDWPELLEGEPPREDVQIWFADKDPVQIQFDEGRLRVTLAVARLEKSPHVWENFLVRVAYRPERIGEETQFVRDGVVSLTGDSLSLKDQIALRGVFSKTFSKDRSWPVLPKIFRERPELAQFRLSHLVLEDGWFSWALAGTGGDSPDRPRGIRARFATANHP
jgi:hypothetical protein